MTFEQFDKTGYGQVLLISVIVDELIIAIFVFQTGIDDLLFAALFLRFKKVKHGHLWLLFALSVLYPLLVLLWRGLFLFGFVLFGFFLKIGFVIREIVLFRFLLFRLFVVKGVWLVVDLYKNGPSDG